MWCTETPEALFLLVKQSMLLPATSYFTAVAKKKKIKYTHSGVKARSRSPQKTVSKPMYFTNLWAFVCIKMALPIIKSKRLCKSHGTNTAKCCITFEHTIQHIFSLSIPLWGRKVSSSCFSGGCKRDALCIPTLQKIYRRGTFFVSAVPAVIIRVTSSMISDV